MTAPAPRAGSVADTASSACASGSRSTAASSRSALEPPAGFASTRGCRSSSRERRRRTWTRKLAHLTRRRHDRRHTLPIGNATMRTEPWLRRHALDGLIIALAAVQQAEALIAPVPGLQLAVMLATALWTLPLLLRHRLPFLAPTFALAVQIGASFTDPNAFGGEATGLVALLLTFWVVGAENPAHQAVAGAAIGCATLAVIAERDDRVSTGGAIFVMVMGVAVTLIA